jgi:hypothetical protein
MATQSGKFVTFGYTGTDGIAATGLTGTMLLQSHDFEHAHDEVQIKSASGDLVTRVLYNESSKATLEVIPSSATDVATARTNKATLIALKDTILNITACADAAELVSTNWLVVGVKVAGSNTGEHKVTLTMEKHAGITTTPA